jgi:hypothetical protein
VPGLKCIPISGLQDDCPNPGDLSQQVFTGFLAGRLLRLRRLSMVENHQGAPIHVDHQVRVTLIESVEQAQGFFSPLIQQARASFQSRFY